MKRFQVHVRTRLDTGKGGVKQPDVDKLSAFNDSLAPMFENGGGSMVEVLDNVAYGTVFGVVDRKDAPVLAGVKFRDPEAATILAEDFKKRAKEAGLEAAASTISRSAYVAQGGW